MPRHLVVRTVSVFAAASLVLGLATGAAASPRDSRRHPDFDTRWAAIRVVGVVAPDLTIFELTARDAAVARRDWTDRGKEAVARGLETAMRERGVEAMRFVPSTEEEMA